MVLECVSHYEASLNHPNIGKPFPELYNIETIEPGEEWLGVYHQVRDALTDLGLDMDNGWRKTRYDRKF